MDENTQKLQKNGQKILRKVRKNDKNINVQIIAEKFPNL